MTQRLELPQIFLGDLMKAVHHLQPKDRITHAAIVEMLNLADTDSPARAPSEMKWSLPPERPAAPPIVRPLLEATDDKDVGETELDAVEDEDLASSDPNIADAVVSAKNALPWARRRRLLPMRIEVIAPARSKPFTAPRVPSATDEEHEPSPDLLPLFDPAWTRALLTAAIRNEVEEGPIDLEAVVDRFARGDFPATLPRLPMWSLRRGVQLLADCGAGMAPFTRDVEALTAAIVRLAGPELVRTLRFRCGPWDGVYDIALKANLPYEPPLPGVPVILMTEFGIARQPFSPDAAPPGAWRAFIRDLRNHGCRVVALIPYPRDRWPRALAGLAEMIPWDRRTTVVQIHAARNQGRAV